MGHPYVGRHDCNEHRLGGVMKKILRWFKRRKVRPNITIVEGTEALTNMFLDYMIDYNYYDREEETPSQYQADRLIRDLYERGILEAKLTQKDGYVFYVKEPQGSITYFAPSKDLSEVYK